MNLNWNSNYYLYTTINNFYKRAMIPNIDKDNPEVAPLEKYVQKTRWNLIVYDDEKLKEVSKDGFTIYKDGKYNIFIGKLEKKSKRNRFTLAHEIGHIVLNHHKLLKSNLIKFDANTKNIFEKQANIFAENILMPVHLVDRFEYEDNEALSTIFEVSKAMVVVRKFHLDRDKYYIEKFK